MSQKLSVIDIRKAFDELNDVFYAKTTNHADRLLKTCAAEERTHRGLGDSFKRCHTVDTIGVMDVARLFAVKRVATYLTHGISSYPRGKDFLSYQTSCFFAAGIVDEYGDEVRHAWRGQSLGDLAALNYTDYVKIENAQPA